MALVGGSGAWQAAASGEGPFGGVITVEVNRRELEAQITGSAEMPLKGSLHISLIADRGPRGHAPRWLPVGPII